MFPSWSYFIQKHCQLFRLHLENARFGKSIGFLIHFWKKNTNCHCSSRSFLISKIKLHSKASDSDCNTVFDGKGGIGFINVVLDLGVLVISF